MNGEDPFNGPIFCHPTISVRMIPCYSSRRHQLFERTADFAARDGSCLPKKWDDLHDGSTMIYASTGRRDGEEMWNCDEFAVSQCIYPLVKLT